MRRVAYRAALRIFFGTVVNIGLCIVETVYVVVRQLVLKRNLKMLESGIDPGTSRFEVDPGPLIALNCPVEHPVDGTGLGSRSTPDFESRGPRIDPRFQHF